MASPTVEPDPDNAGVGKLLIQAFRQRNGLFLFKKFRGSMFRVQGLDYTLHWLV
jgi:hypothetical protein